MVEAPVSDEERGAPIVMSSQNPAMFSTEGDSERCRVFVRLRPLPDGEIIGPLKVGEGNRIAVAGREYLGTPSRATPRKKKNGEDDPSFEYDKVFEQDATQDDVFAAILGNSVESVLEGFNATVLAYGQTGAGKTYNMFGEGDAELRGIIPRAFDEIFERIAQDVSGSNFEVKLSMTEIYMEELIDLLRPSAFPKLRLRESLFAGVWVEGLNHVSVTSSKSALELVLQGIAQRAVGATNMNEQSSRSHCIVSLRVEKALTDGMVQTGVLHFADLAGMERVDRTGAQGQTLEEAKRINLSLSALGNCISALADPSRTHIPFRDAKLTFLLKNSLGGNAKTTLLVACSSRQKDLDETMGALRFGARARSVKNIVKVNRKLSAQELQRLLDKLQQEHRALQAYCLSLEEQLEQSAKENKVPAGKRVSMLGGQLTPGRGSPSTASARMENKALAAFKSPPPLPMSPAMMMATPGMESSPARGLDPMALLHRIAVLEAERVDMLIEIEALGTFSPTGVAGTSISRHASETIALGTSRLSWGGGGAGEVEDAEVQYSPYFEGRGCEAFTQMSPTIVAAPAVVVSEIELLRGTLKKRGKSFLGLQRSVGCELTATSFCYDSRLDGLRKEIRLGGVKACAALPGGLGFSLEVGKAGGRKFLFTAGSEKERARWLSALAQRGVATL